VDLEGNEGSKFYFDFLKRKFIANKVLDLHRVDGYLVEDLGEVKGMFSFHFQNIFSPYALTNGVVVTRDACCMIFPHKVLNGDRNTLDKYFLREELHVSLTHMQNGNSLGIDGLPCEFYKAIKETINGDFYCLDFEVFASSRLLGFLTRGIVKIIPNAARHSTRSW
jgi:hypothetical protein